jgi:hypothetical protein
MIWLVEGIRRDEKGERDDDEEEEEEEEEDNQK